MRFLYDKDFTRSSQLYKNIPEKLKRQENERVFSARKN